METRVAPAKIFDFRLLDGLNHALWDEFHLVVNASQMLHGVKQQGCTATEQWRSLRGYDGTVFHLDGGGMVSALDLALVGCHCNGTRCGGDLCLVEEQAYLVYLVLVISAVGHLVGGVVEAAYDFVFGCLAAHLVVADTEAHHVDAHVGGRFIGIFAVDTFEESVQHGEDFDVTIVVDGCLSVCLKMERINHIDIVEVGGRSLVGDVHGMLQWKVPHRESLELGIAGTCATLVLVIEL